MVEQHPVDVAVIGAGQAGLSAAYHLRRRGYSPAPAESPSFVVLDAESAQQEAERLRRMIDAPLLASPKLTFEGLDVYDVEPALLPDLFAERPLAVFGKWRGPAQGRLRVEGYGSQGPFLAEVPIVAAEVRKDSQALTHLWARRRVATLVDQETLEGGYEHSQAILDLGLKYGLLTPYTSFVAVDEQVRNPDPAAAAKVQQPLPLPQGPCAILKPFVRSSVVTRG